LRRELAILPTVTAETEGRKEAGRGGNVRLLFDVDVDVGGKHTCVRGGGDRLEAGDFRYLSRLTDEML
jgi:hypothetical protein